MTKLPTISIFAMLAMLAFLTGFGAGEDDTGEGKTVMGFVSQNTLAGCGEIQYLSPEPAAVLPDNFRTVIMGSSSAAGAGASSLSLSWAGQYAAWQQQSNRTTVNLAKGGHTTYHALPEYCQPVESRKQPDIAHNISRVLAEQPDLVLIAYPSNDAALGWAATESVSNIMLLRTLLAEAGVASVVLSAKPRNMSAAAITRLQQFDMLLSQEVKDCVVPLFDILQLDQRLNPALDSGDGVHVNDEGHVLIFNALRDMLTQGRCVVLPE